MMKTICFFSGDISRAGGTERVATVIASKLAERGFDVSILSLSRGEASLFPLHRNVRLFSLNMERYSANFSDFRIWRQLRSFIKLQAIDVLVDVDVILSWHSIPAALGTTCEVIAWEHFHLFVNIGDVLQRWRRALGRRMAARFSKAVVTLTEKDRQQYLGHLRCRSDIIAISNPTTIAHDNQAPLDSKVVLAAGRLVSQKGFDLLLDAWRLANAQELGWRLRIVGSGADEHLLKGRAQALNVSGSVDFFQHSSDMAGHFMEASIFAFASRFEGFGLVLTEAKSFGLPIVSFDCDCGPSDIVRDGHDGILVPKEDVAGFARGLRELMDDQSKRMTMGRLGYKDDRFDILPIVRKWEILLSSGHAQGVPQKY